MHTPSSSAISPPTSSLDVARWPELRREPAGRPFSRRAAATAARWCLRASFRGSGGGRPLMMVVQEPGQPLAQILLVARADQDRLLEQFLLDVLRQSATHVDYGLAQQMRHELTIIVHAVSLVPGERGRRRAAVRRQTQI